MAESNVMPPWLKKAQSSSHITTVLKALRQRESLRDVARTATRCANKLNVPIASPGTRERARTWFASLFTGKSQGAEQEYFDYYSVAIGSSHENMPRNRYLDIEPYDRTRAVAQIPPLNLATDQKQEGYLNASWVQELYGKKWWVAQQAPLRSTAHTFLSLIFQPIVSSPNSSLESDTTSPSTTVRIRTVVQLTRDIEGGRLKAHAYFPSQIGQSWVVAPEAGFSSPPLEVTLVHRTQIPSARCVKSVVSISRVTSQNAEQDGQQPETAEDKDSVTFTHLLYTAWPDHDVPEDEDRQSLIEFARLVDATNKEIPDAPAQSIHPDPPVAVGCSAGIGRTGAFIALSSLLRAYNFLPAEPTASQPTESKSPLGILPQSLADDMVVHEIDSLREQRPGMVQRDEQVMFVYAGLASMFSAAD